MRAFCLLFLLFLASCSSSRAPTRFQGLAMHVPFNVLIGDSLNGEKSMQVEAEIWGVFTEINQIYNNWNPLSEVSALNQAEANQKICLSSNLASFLQKVDSLVGLTEGRFDPTVRKDGHSEAVGWHKHIHLEGLYFGKIIP